MEGLFFEASGTTPYHFLTTAAMSKQSSNPVRELRYVDNDATVGVPHLQALGVSYLMVRTDEAKREAAEQDDLTLLAESGPWEIYRVADSEVVVPLDVQPVVVDERPGDQRERHLELGTSWFQHRDEWAAMPADDGPGDVAAHRRRARPRPGARRTASTSSCRPSRSSPSPCRRSRSATSRWASRSCRSPSTRSVCPVLVKVSYFPNWEVDGAEGPYRIAPNMMVVVPTENEVRLHFDRSASDLSSTC